MQQRRSSKIYNLEAVMHHGSVDKRRTKIICTMGPSCWDVDKLVQMIDSGMNVARLNFSHGDHKGHGEVVARLREAFKQRKDKPVALLLDTKGPEIRTGLLKEGLKTISLKAGQDLTITTDFSFRGDETKIACSYKGLTKSVKVGGQILIADGSLVCRVKEILEDSIVVQVVNDCQIGERKNMNLPGCEVDLPTVTEQDENDIVNFGVEQNIDMIALSFTRRAADIEYVRDIMGPRGYGVKIIAKIENQEGLNNFDEILEAADGIMVARGDLGMEIPASKVFVAQKWMCKKCNDAGKPVIVATQMLESMIKNPRPTRAEAGDVANAVLDGADCVMLSGETANGSFPLQAVQIMAEICTEAEDCYDNYEMFWNETQRLLRDEDTEVSDLESLSASAVQMSFILRSNIIIVFTQTGEAARLIAKYKPRAYIIAVSFEDKTIKGLTLIRGVKTLRVPSFQGLENLINYAINVAKEVGAVKKGDKVICLTGQSEENKNDTLTVRTVQ